MPRHIALPRVFHDLTLGEPIIAFMYGVMAIVVILIFIIAFIQHYGRDYRAYGLLLASFSFLSIVGIIVHEYLRIYGLPST